MRVLTTESYWPSYRSSQRFKCAQLNSFLYARADLDFQDLLVVASLAAILLHGSLSAILSDHGLPLGLATSSFSFARVSYFWSPAFLGGAMGLCQQRRLRGSLIVFFVLLSGMLAAVVGPASAVLMLPRTKVLNPNKTYLAKTNG